MGHKKMETKIYLCKNWLVYFKLNLTEINKNKIKENKRFYGISRSQ